MSQQEYFVPNTKIRYRWSDGWQVSDDNGLNWYFTFRALDDFRTMHPTLSLGVGVPPVEDDEDAERELFGETIDEEIPDDLWEMIS